MAVDQEHVDDVLLSAPADQDPAPLDRIPAAYTPIPTYSLPRGENRQYQQQYADMYFARLTQLKPAAEHIASQAWDGFAIGDDEARRVQRVLDVRQGELCWVVGTCFMEMPLKPNVLEDIGKEHWIAAPPPREKYTDAENDQIMLEDESGRLRLTGATLKNLLLVTGAIVAVIGTENKDGDFEVLDLKVPDLPRQPARWENEDEAVATKGKGVSQEKPSGGKVAIVSGLGVTAEDGHTVNMGLLLEWLLGEASAPTDQQDASQISRLIIAGNSLANGSPILSRDEIAAAAARNSGPKKYGYDSSSYNAIPTAHLDEWLSTLLPSMPITLIPGEHDPTSTSLPQQPIHAAMFLKSRTFMELADSKEISWFDTTTNPADFSLQGWRFLGTGGQPLDDVYRYVAGEQRLDMMEAMLRWRLIAPTAPDTLWCYPFQSEDRFVLNECPHVFLAGNQPAFQTRTVEGNEGQKVRIVAVPKFAETGQVVLMDLETLEIETVRIEAFEVEGG